MMVRIRNAVLDATLRDGLNSLLKEIRDNKCVVPQPITDSLPLLVAVRNNFSHVPRKETVDLRSTRVAAVVAECIFNAIVLNRLPLLKEQQRQLITSQLGRAADTLEGEMNNTQLFRKARIEVMGFMEREFNSEGLSNTIRCPWKEQTVTDLLAQALMPEICVVRPSGYEESVIGADILWWFVEERTKEAFGMLCQAKNLKRNIDQDFAVDVGYNNGEQLANLLQSEDIFGVTSNYLIYSGHPSYRAGLKLDGRAEHAAYALTLASSSVVEKNFVMGFSGSGLASAIIDSSTPLESVLTPDRKNKLAFPGMRQWMRNSPDEESAEEFIRFLQEPQTGVREMARHMMKMKLSIGEFSVLEANPDLESSIFPRIQEVPRAFESVLRGLRSSPPPYLALSNSSDWTFQEQALSTEQLNRIDGLQIWVTMI